MYHQIWNASEFCLDPSIFFSDFNWLPDNLLCKTVIWADDYTLNISCDKPYYLSQQVVIWSYKYEKKKTTQKLSWNAIMEAIIYLGNYSIFTS